MYWSYYSHLVHLFLIVASQNEHNILADMVGNAGYVTERAAQHLCDGGGREEFASSHQV